MVSEGVRLAQGANRRLLCISLTGVLPPRLFCSLSPFERRFGLIFIASPRRRFNSPLYGKSFKNVDLGLRLKREGMQIWQVPVWMWLDCGILVFNWEFLCWRGTAAAPNCFWLFIFQRLRLKSDKISQLKIISWDNIYQIQYGLAEA